MALQSRTITVGADRDSNNGGKNYVSGQVIYIKDELGVLAPIFRDIDGLDPIPQNTISNVTNAKGQFTFFIEEGNYIAEYNDQSTSLFVFGADYFNNQIDFVTAQVLAETQGVVDAFNQEGAEALAEFDLTLDQYKESRGFNTKGTFAAGFTYELPNDVGLDANGNPWILIDTSSLPVTVNANTTPTNPPFKQVAYGTAAQVSTNTSDTAQSFIDSFALKIFQSPTDGLTEINTRTLLGSEVYEVRKVSDGTLATIYSDKEGLNPITQDGTNNVSGSDGVVEFYIADGDYHLVVNSIPTDFTVLTASKVIRSYSSGDIANQSPQLGVKYSVSNYNDGVYEVVSAADSGGFYIPLSASLKLKYKPKNAVAYLSEVGASNAVDSSNLLPLLASAGFKTIVVNTEVLCSTGGYVIPETIKVQGNGKFLVDWESIGYGTVGNEGFVYHFTGDKVLWKHVDSESLTGKVTPFVEQEYTSFLRFTGDKCKVRHTTADYHPNYVFAVLDDTKKFDFISNEGEGWLNDNTEQTGVHCLLYQRDGLQSVTSHNEGENFCNVILYGLAPQKSTVNYNKGVECGNHVFYGSSADNCHAQGNEAYGTYTDFKIRGDNNVAINNIVEGGSFSLTNRIVDTGNGIGLNSVVSMGNVITCRRDLAIAYSIRARTGFDCEAREITSTGNVIKALNTSPNGLLILFDTIRKVTCNDEVLCNNTVTDGVRITPTDGISVGKISKIMLSGSSIGASNQAHQLTGSTILSSLLNASSGGGSGSNGGCLSVRASRFTLSAFDIEVTGNTYGINIIELSNSATIDSGVITRPVGGTLPHVFNGGAGTVTEGALITKVN